MLISDRGYPSNAMLNKLINDDMAFLTGRPIAVGSNEEKWIFAQGLEFERRTQAWDRVYRVYSHTFTESWQKSNKKEARPYLKEVADPKGSQHQTRQEIQKLVI